MKTRWKIPTVCLKLLLVLVLLLGTQATAKADQFDEGLAAYEAGNFQKAFELFKPFAEKGLASAQYNLGIMYVNGRGVPQDYKEALKWFRKAAEQGEAMAQNNLGGMYDRGKGVPENYKEALKWYRKAADQGFDIAQFNLGTMYFNGRGVVQDYTKAVKLYRLAAEQGDAQAQLNLGVMYLDGFGETKDYVKAHKWSNIAAFYLQPGDYKKLAQKNRNIAEERMTPAQVAEAQKLASEWKPKTWEELSQQN